MSLLKAIGVKHSGKEKLKLHFDILVQKVTNLSEFNQKQVFLAWKRGSRKNSGRVKDVLVINGEAMWNERITLKSTLFKDQESGRFDEKMLSIALKLSDEKSIGKMDIDLGHYAKHDALHASEIAFSNKTRGSPILHVTIQSRWVKMNDKVLIRQPTVVPEENAPGTAQGHTPIVDIDGQSYSLKTEEVATTDGSVDSTNTGSWEEEEGGEKEDPFVSTSMYEAEVKRTHEEAETLRKQLRLVEGESQQRGKTIELQERELLGLRQKLEMMESKYIEHEELVQRAYGLEAFMQQQLALARQGYEDSVKALKSEIAVLEKKQDVKDQDDDEVYEVPEDVDKKEVDKNQKQSTQTDSKGPCGADVERLMGERDELARRVEALHLELDRSAHSFVMVATQLTEKEKRISALASHNKILQQQLEATIQLSPIVSSDGDNNLQEESDPLPPLFSNPLLDKHHPYFVVFVFLILLSLISIIF